MGAKLIKTKTGFYLWRNPLDKSQELLGATVPIMNDNGVDLREYKLSLKNCQEIERGYDLDELIDKYCRGNSKIEDDFIKKGFQKAIEILGDKKFSEEDMKEAYSRGFLQQGIKSFNSLIQSQQQTEWSVEVIMEDKLLGLSLINPIPKLDADGCLILKRK